MDSITELWQTFAGRCTLSAAFTLASLLAWWAWPQQWKRSWQIALLLSMAVIARVLVLPLPASDDVHRYVWEGQLVLEGISPYAATADDPQYARRHDEHWQQMNHRDQRTAYPPLTLLMCAAVEGAQLYSSHSHLLGFKLSAALADVLTLILLIIGVSQLRWVVLYALNPVPLISYMGEGHFDAWMVLCMVASIVWIHRPRLAWAALALGISIKFIAVVLVPVLWHHTAQQHRRATVIIACVLLLGPALPFAATLPELMQGVLRFGMATSSNATLHWLLELALNHKPTASILCGIAFITWLLKRRAWQGSPAEASRSILTAMLICAPTVTYWYPGWALPFAVLAPHPALWLLSATDIFYYAAWQEATVTGTWWLPRWAWALLWGPFLWSVWRRRY